MLGLDTDTSHNNIDDKYTRNISTERLTLIFLEITWEIVGWGLLHIDSDAKLMV